MCRTPLAAARPPWRRSEAEACAAVQGELARGGWLAAAAPRRTGCAALAAGAHHATAAVIERALAEARGRKTPRRKVELVLTGGAALQVSALLRVPHRLEANLVLRGLARAVRRVG